MEPALESAAVSMMNNIKNIQVVANNIANLNTTGFKRGLTFNEVLNEESENINSKLTDYSEGVFLETRDPLNVAISGKAFFTVKTPEGEHLTKNGDFTIDKQGFLSTREGHRVLGQNGEINLQDEIIEGNGNLVFTKNGEIKSNGKIISRLKLSKVEDQQKLIKTEGQRFYNTEKRYDVADNKDFEIHHGYLESSNTNAIIEMQSMIQLQKDYEASSKMISSIDSSMALIKEMGKV